ncbi:hypothetical protein COV58_01865 [Candidatus Roizmanbacteria bacterium CG11_big_fil_rev_8_21_14_0_20_36_8]|uniref:Uncharacterized protein n=2 Tax=Candidatus Roizmaniibacteriota TaxID=1752723 RepID=A0A2M6IUG0_9BACT|nr:MAG: hypothetical protein COV58_01865 [Candidatus Roizmanbacteria bacterium CG11_big_fil_rev_8_21_14_0_20_36_8]PIZ66129.1 MAG: hypothetical protein COY14_00885 [Candidatus Roizmanbacteria bacterium CG_4_10_14_0_2_um_filter_36_9]
MKIHWKRIIRAILALYLIYAFFGFILVFPIIEFQNFSLSIFNFFTIITVVLLPIFFGIVYIPMLVTVGFPDTQYLLGDFSRVPLPSLLGLLIGLLCNLIFVYLLYRLFDHLSRSKLSR